MTVLGLRDALVICFCGSLLWYRYRRRQPHPLPPSLPGWPIVGNALQLPLTYVHLFYKDLAQRLGSKIVYVEALGQPIIVISDARIASNLLEKRSTIYSSRPQNQMLSEVVGAKYFFALLPYGEEWRNHRRIFQQHFSAKTTPREQETALKFIHEGLLSNIYQNPEGLRQHVDGCIGGISLSMTYGLPVQRRADPLIHKSAEAFAIAMATASPGKYLVNVFPILKYVPKWFPGAGFKRLAPIVLAQLLEVLNEPYEKTLNRMTSGKAPDSFVSSSLDAHRHRPDFEMNEKHIKQAASQIFGAASETTVASVMTFILAMLKYPEIQRKAQAEVDSIVGSDRLPDFSDRENMPYLTAVLKEVVRWNPIAPMGVPHATTQEDTYEGYYIPKGAAVMVNQHAILHDEGIFPNPKDFKPERFIKNGVLLTNVLDPFVVGTFGFGRRICPGAQIALSILYLAATSIISVFDITPATDAEDSPINVIPEFIAASLVSEPLPFPCKIKPRKGKNVEGLLQEYLGNDVL